MKRHIFEVALLLTIGWLVIPPTSAWLRESSTVTTPRTAIYSVDHEGHRYTMWHKRVGPSPSPVGGFIHSPACPCHTEPTEP